MDDDGYPFQPTPKHVRSLMNEELVSAVCGDVHSMVLTIKGEIFSFGGCTFGQLGLGNIEGMPLDADRYPYVPMPTKIKTLKNITFIACGDSHSMAIDCDGKLYSWGACANYQLGIDSFNLMPKDAEGGYFQPEPAFVAYFENTKVKKVACGETHSLVLTETGILYRCVVN